MRKSGRNVDSRESRDRDRGGAMGDSEGDAAGKLFIGGVSWQTTEASLREHFGKYGELIDAALMRNKHTGQPRGFGFVKFKEAVSADKVCATTHVLDGRTVDVKRAVPREKTCSLPPPSLASSSSSGSKAAEAPSPRTGSGCNGAVGGSSNNSVHKASTSNDSKGGSSAENKSLSSKGVGGSMPAAATSSSSSGGGLVARGKSSAAMLEAGGGATASALAAAAAHAAAAAAAAAVVPEQARKIFVGGLAPSVTDADFRLYFEKFGAIVDAVVMFDRQTQRSRGFGFITFEVEASLEGVFEVSDRHELKGKGVEVKRAEPKEQTAARQQAAAVAAAAAAQHAMLLDPSLVLSLPPGAVPGMPSVHPLMHPPPPTPQQIAAAAHASAHAAALAAAAHQRALDDAAGLTLAQRLARDLAIEKKGKAASPPGAHTQPPRQAEGSAAAAAAAADQVALAQGELAEVGWDMATEQTGNGATTLAGLPPPPPRLYNPSYGALALQEHMPVPGMVRGGGHGVGFGVLYPQNSGTGSFVPAVDPSAAGAVYALPFYSGPNGQGVAAGGAGVTPVAPYFAYAPMPDIYFNQQSAGAPPTEVAPVVGGGYWGAGGFDYTRAWYQGEFSMDASYNATGYGGYRGQAATHGRLSRKFRPY